jgi:hypothetical protein
MHRFLPLLILLFILSVQTPLMAEVHAEIDTSLIYMGGFTKYQIGGDYTINDSSGSLRFPVSELEFPLDSLYASVRGSVEFEKFIRIDGKFEKNLGRNTGKLKDSDWGYLYYDYHSELPQTSPDSLDVYSESNCDLNATIWDINIGYRIVDESKFTMLIAAGFMQQHFDFTVSNLDQWYPSYTSYFGDTNEGIQYGVYPYHQYISGRILEYEITYNIPYIKANFGFRPISKMLISSDLAISPFVSAKDSDNHLLRDKTAKGDCTGIFFKTNIDVKYQFNRFFYSGSQLDYIYIGAKGDQKQSGSGYSAKIEEEVSSSQLSISLYAGFHF